MLAKHCKSYGNINERGKPLNIEFPTLNRNHRERILINRKKERKRKRKIKETRGASWCCITGLAKVTWNGKRTNSAIIRKNIMTRRTVKIYLLFKRYMRASFKFIGEVLLSFLFKFVGEVLLSFLCIVWGCTSPPTSFKLAIYLLTVGQLVGPSSSSSPRLAKASNALFSISYFV